MKLADDHCNTDSDVTCDDSGQEMIIMLWCLQLLSVVTSCNGMVIMMIYGNCELGHACW